MVQGHVVSRMQQRVARGLQGCLQGRCKTDTQKRGLKANELPQLAPAAVVMSVLCDHSLKLCNGAAVRAEDDGYRASVESLLFSCVSVRASIEPLLQSCDPGQVCFCSCKPPSVRKLAYSIDSIIKSTYQQPWQPLCQ